MIPNRQSPALLTGVRMLGRQVHDLLFPPRCVSCDAMGAWLCPPCAQSVEPVGDLICRRCGRAQATATDRCPFCSDSSTFKLTLVRSAAFHQSPLRQAIHAFKYESCTELSTPLARYLVAAYAKPCWALADVPVDLVVPVPLHEDRRSERGFNQSELLAADLCRIVGLPMDALALQRVRHTPTSSWPGRSLTTAECGRCIQGLSYARRQTSAAHRRCLYDGRHPLRLCRCSVRSRRRDGQCANARSPAPKPVTGSKSQLQDGTFVTKTKGQNVVDNRPIWVYDWSMLAQAPSFASQNDNNRTTRQTRLMAVGFAFGFAVEADGRTLPKLSRPSNVTLSLRSAMEADVTTYKPSFPKSCIAIQPTRTL